MNTPRAASLTCCLAAATLGASMLCGCAHLPWHKVPLDASSGFYQATKVTYRLDAGKLRQPLDVTRVEGQRVAFDQVASSPLAEQSFGTLEIISPHPTGRAGFARASFVLDSGRASAKKSSPLSFLPGMSQPEKPVGFQPEIHELWVLDIPTAESDWYLQRIANLNFYNGARTGSGGTQLTVNLNGREVQKEWDQVAELNALAQRVRRDGQLAEYRRPAVLAGTSSKQAITSTHNYAEMLHVADGTPPAAWGNAFAMAPPVMPPQTPAQTPSATPQNPAIVARAPSGAR